MVLGPGSAHSSAWAKLHRIEAQASNAFRAISSVVLQSLHQQGLDAASIRLLRVELARLSCCRLLVGKEVSLLRLSCVKVYLGDSHELAVTGLLGVYAWGRDMSRLRASDQQVTGLHGKVQARATPAEKECSLDAKLMCWWISMHRYFRDFGSDSVNR